MDQRRIHKVRRNDRIAHWVITGGGMLIIATVVGMFFLIASVAIPLYFSPQIDHRKQMPLPLGITSSQVLAVGTDSYLETGYVLLKEGAFIFFDWRSGQTLERLRAGSSQKPGVRLRSVESAPGHRFSLLWENGAVSALAVVFAPKFDAQGRRHISHQVEELATLSPAETASGRSAVKALARFDEERGLIVAVLLPGGRLMLHRIVKKEDLLGNITTERGSIELVTGAPGSINAVAMDLEGRLLYAGTRDGQLMWWNLEEPDDPRLLGKIQAFPDRRAITALAAVPGDAMVAVGDAQGGISTWLDLPDANTESGRRLVRNHTLRGHGAPVRRLMPSLQSRSLASSNEAGGIHFDHTTNERELLTLAPPQPMTQLGLSTRFNALAGLDAQGALHLWETDIPHPEASWSGYFSKLWYGSYSGPAYVWQSSSADDDFEPKLSLMPLVFGTLKGTFYGMLFAAPLAILGAMYTSHLMHAGFRRVVKPAIEIMGSVPTVVVGFLAALWLAPILKTSLIAIIMLLALLPLMILLAVVLWERASKLLPRKLPSGYEFLLLAPVVVLSASLCFLIGAWLEDVIFGGDFTQWLYENLQVNFDQRNSIVIAFALGFAVIPTIFTISDDALLNVPRNLTAASLALGASRWQTVWRVVLPSASPGIFAALMIGLGRAVGETMIVLMATGNTPVMEWGAFSGMRTLSANIAVEIPEAPLDSTLYRTLFMSAVLLFMMTFLLNSAAEVVRQWLRRKYGRY